MNILKNYMSWCENLMSPQPMHEQDMSSVRLRRLRWTGTVLCLWLYGIISLAIFANDKEGIRILLLPIIDSKLLLPILLVFILLSLAALVCLFYLSSHRGLLRLNETLNRLDEWEKQQALDINRYGHYIAIGTVALVLFMLAVKGLFVGLFNLTAINVGLIFAMSAVLQIFGSFTIWTWKQKPLKS